MLYKILIIGALEVTKPKQVSKVLSQSGDIESPGTNQRVYYFR